MTRKAEVQAGDIVGWAEECRVWSVALDEQVGKIKALKIQAITTDSVLAFARARTEMRRVLVAVGNAVAEQELTVALAPQPPRRTTRRE